LDWISPWDSARDDPYKVDRQDFVFDCGVSGMSEIERLREEVCKRCGVISGQLYGKCAACEYKPLPAPPQVEK